MSTSPAGQAAQTANRDRRVAMLVIHGMGEQKPYETLDQFARGLLSGLRIGKNVDWSIAPELQTCTDPMRIQKDWTRTSIRLTPQSPLPGIKDVTLFEYYWAPITENKITYLGSISFLMSACLKPFRYMYSNVDVIARAGRLQGQKLPKTRILLKEFARILFLFGPLLVALFCLLKWVSESGAISQIAKIDILLLTVLALALIRALYVWTLGSYLWDALHSRAGWQRSVSVFIVTVASVLVWILLPYWLPPVLQPIAGWSHRQSLANLAQEIWRGGAGNSMLRGFSRFIYLDTRLSHPLLLAAAVAAAALVRWILIHYVGDVALYVNSDARAESFAARSQILDECAQSLTGILIGPADPANPRGSEGYRPEFDNVIVAGHSLGSVIAYDTISEMLNRCRTGLEPAPDDLERLTGMITFGSPLNKIFYFFREQVDAKQAIRKQIIDLLYSFRSLIKPSVPLDEKFAYSPPALWREAEEALELNFKWINVWSLSDPINGKMLFYDLQSEANQKCLWYSFPLSAHVFYWSDPKFYKYLIDEFFPNP